MSATPLIIMVLVTVGISCLMPKKSSTSRRPHKKRFSTINVSTPLIQKVRERKENRRLQETCVSELPRMLDVLALGLSAGLSFDGALALYCQKSRAELARHLECSMYEWQLGLASRTQVLCELAERVNSAAFSRFINATTEALLFGLPLARMLVRQSELLRCERRRELEEQIEKAPVKMLIPLGVFVLPSMLLAVLGPLFSAAIS